MQLARVIEASRRRHVQTILQIQSEYTTTSSCITAEHTCFRKAVVLEARVRFSTLRRILCDDLADSQHIDYCQCQNIFCPYKRALLPFVAARVQYNLGVFGVSFTQERLSLAGQFNAQ